MDLYEACSGGLEEMMRALHAEGLDEITYRSPRGTLVVRSSLKEEYGTPERPALARGRMQRRRTGSGQAGPAPFRLRGPLDPYLRGGGGTGRG